MKEKRQVLIETSGVQWRLRELVEEAQWLYSCVTTFGSDVTSPSKLFNTKAISKCPYGMSNNIQMTMLRGEIDKKKSLETDTDGHPFVWHADTFTRHELVAVQFGVDNEEFV